MSTPPTIDIVAALLQHGGTLQRSAATVIERRRAECEKLERHVGTLLKALRKTQRTLNELATYIPRDGETGYLRNLSVIAKHAAADADAAIASVEKPNPTTHRTD